MGWLGYRPGRLGATPVNKLCARNVGMRDRTPLDVTCDNLGDLGHEPYRRMAYLAAVGFGGETVAGRWRQPVIFADTVHGGGWFNSQRIVSAAHRGRRHAQFFPRGMLMNAKVLVCLALLLPVAGCGSEETTSSLGDPVKGKAAIAEYGCGSCHAIPDVPGANGRTGPTLERIAKRTYLAGVLPNTPEDMVRWIRAPEKIDPRTAMPNMAVSVGDARDITAYLYTLK